MSKKEYYVQDITMNEIDFTGLLFGILPAIIVGVIAYYFFNMHTKNEEQRRRFLLRKANQNTALPIRLQAYERMTLYLERISLGQILFRVKPVNNDKMKYEHLLIRTIEQEFEHNVAQQIYLTPDCWDVIKTTKNATIGIIRRTNKQEGVDSADKLREVILNNLMEKQPPTDAALAFIKKEVKAII